MIIYQVWKKTGMHENRWLLLVTMNYRLVKNNYKKIKKKNIIILTLTIN